LTPCFSTSGSTVGPPGNQGFLIRQGNVFAGFDGGQSGQKPGTPYDPRHHGLSVAITGNFYNAIITGKNLRLRINIGQGSFQFPKFFSITNGDNFGLELPHLLGQQFNVIACGNPYQTKLIGMVFKNIEGLGTDGAGRTEQGDGFHENPHG
jgi:hypothetical protein